MTNLHWSSRLTFMLAAVGSAVGLGNIWRFPYVAGVNGGGAFVMIYIAAVMLLALPVLIAELMIGRRGGASPPLAIATVAKESGRSRQWGWMSIVLGVIGAVLLLAFISVVGGWTVAYVVKLGTRQLQDINASDAQILFDNINSDPVTLLIWFSLFLGTTVYISARGLHAGVERAVRLMMPALFFMLLLMISFAAYLGDLPAAAAFLLTPDFAKVNTHTVLSAFGQAFFSVSVGLTHLMAYGAYVKRTTSLPSSAAIIVSADTVVALLAGFAIFPFIFASGLEPGAGPGLVFIALPIAFGKIAGGVIIGGLFFVLLFFAALTSSIAMMEAPVAWLQDTRAFSRKQAALLVGFVSYCLGVPAALSFNLLSEFYPLNFLPLFGEKTVFDSFEYLVTTIMMPLGGILIALFAGWFIKTRFSQEEIAGPVRTIAYRCWLFQIRFLVPVLLLLVFVDLLLTT